MNLTTLRYSKFMSIGNYSKHYAWLFPENTVHRQYCFMGHLQSDGNMISNFYKWQFDFFSQWPLQSTVHHTRVLWKCSWWNPERPQWQSWYVEAQCVSITLTCIILSLLRYAWYSYIFPAELQGWNFLVYFRNRSDCNWWSSLCVTMGSWFQVRIQTAQQNQKNSSISKSVSQHFLFLWNYLNRIYSSMTMTVFLVNFKVGILCYLLDTNPVCLAKFIRLMCFTKTPRLPHESNKISIKCGLLQLL